MTSSRKRYVKLTILFTFCHPLLLIICFSVAFSRRMHRLDHPDFPVTISEKVSNIMLRVLEQPYEATSRLTHFSKPWQSTLELLNSVLWAAMCAFVACLFFRS